MPAAGVLLMDRGAWSLIGGPSLHCYLESQSRKHRLESGSSALPIIWYSSGSPLVNPSLLQLAIESSVVCNRAQAKVYNRGGPELLFARASRGKGRWVSFTSWAVTDSGSSLNVREGQLLEEADRKGEGKNIAFQSLQLPIFSPVTRVLA